MTYLNHRSIPLLSLLMLLPVFLLAAPTITASYTPVSPIYLDTAPGVFTHPSVIGAQLGRFSISAPNGKIYTPSFVNTGEVGDTINLTGLYKTWDGGAYTTRTNLAFKVISVAYPYGLGGTPVLQTIYGGRWPIIDWNAVTVTANPFYVDLYLVNTNSLNPNSAATLGTNGLYYRLDTPYTFTTTFNPVFSLAVADNATTDLGTYAPGNGETITPAGDYVATNGVSGPDVTPILDGNSTTTPEGDGFYYGDGPVLPVFLFSFLESSASFSLEAAYGPNKITINQARFQVANAAAGQTYTKRLTFTDTSAAPAFQLFPTEGAGTPISYQLYLGNDPITKGTPFDWTGLVGDLNSRDLRIGGINEAEVANKVSGTYAGTITVNITNPD